MSTGMYLRAGDETSCGGVILEGYLDWLVDGRPVARDGDAVTCGRNPGKSYTIMGGVWFTMLDGRPAAGTLDSISSCPCEATLIPSVFHFSYDQNGRPARSAEHEPSELTPIHAHAPTPRSSWDNGILPASTRQFTKLPNALQEPGFYVVPKSTTYESLELELFNSPAVSVLRKFRALNPLRGPVKAGQLIVLGDPNNHQCTFEENLLMSVATDIAAQLSDIPNEVADFTAENHQQIQAFLDYGSRGIGVGEAVVGHHLKAIERTLKDIEQLHIRTFLRHGNLRTGEFQAERKKLLAELNSRLDRITRRGVGIPEHPKLKSALGISTRSLVHHWTKAGAPGQIPGYSTNIMGVANAGTYLKYGGLIGIGLGGGVSYMKVQEICRSGETTRCKQARITEAGAFAGSVAGGIAGTEAGIAGAGLMCLAMGAATAGVGLAICGLVGAGVGAVGGGMLGGWLGEKSGELIYEQIQ